MVNKAGLHDLGELGNQVFFFEKEIMGAFLGIDENASHSLKEVVEDLFKVGGLIQGRSACKNVLLEDLEKELHIHRGQPNYRPGKFHR